MDKLEINNRRQTYRHQPLPVMQPVFSIIHGGGRSNAERVLDINMRGARVEFAAGSAPRFKPGGELTVTIQAPGLEGSLDIPARVVFNAERGNTQIVAMVFPDMPELDERCDSAFFSVFNRRQDQRRDKTESASMSAHLVASEADCGPAVDPDLKVVNHSAGGICFIVDEDTDRLIRDRRTFQLALRTQGNNSDHTVSVRVLHRATRAGSVYYGCVYDA